jgi:hypothetical protein
MELEIGMWGYLWVRVHTYGCGWVREGPCGLGMIVHGAWHWYLGVRVGLYCNFSGCGGWSCWSLKLGTWGYLWVHVHTYGCEWEREGPCGLGMMVHGAWHRYMGVRVGLCCIFSGCSGRSWSLKLVG